MEGSPSASLDSHFALLVGAAITATKVSHVNKWRALPIVIFACAELNRAILLRRGILGEHRKQQRRVAVPKDDR